MYSYKANYYNDKPKTAAGNKSISKDNRSHIYMSITGNSPQLTLIESINMIIFKLESKILMIRMIIIIENRFN